MKWISRGTSHYYSAPYSIHSGVMGFDLWLSKPGQYGVLGKFPTLKAAQEFAAKHKAKAALDSGAEPTRAVP